MSEIAETLLRLPNDRILAYSESGNTSSSTVVIFFHGVFGVGNASHPFPILIEKNVHYVAPTLPGWGNSSPIPSSTAYHIGLTSDITALVKNLHSGDTNLKLYIAGGSYGTVPAQMLYGASFDVFPLGKYIAGCLLVAPFSPFWYHQDYTKSLTLSNYIAVGPPSHNIPFRILQRLAMLVISRKVKTVKKAEQFIRSQLFDNMGEEESEKFRKWREETGREEGELERDMAENVVRSVAKTWDGFLEVSDVLHSDWGFRPDALDEEHTKRRLLVVCSSDDKMAQEGMAKWIAATYKNTHLKTVSGGHIAGLFHFDEIFRELLEAEG